MNWVGLWTLTSREVGRFFAVYRQTIIPGFISSILYILIFGFTLEKRISTIDGIPLYHVHYTRPNYDEYPNQCVV